MCIYIYIYIYIYMSLSLNIYIYIYIYIIVTICIIVAICIWFYLSTFLSLSQGEAADHAIKKTVDAMGFLIGLSRRPKFGALSPLSLLSLSQISLSQVFKIWAKAPSLPICRVRPSDLDVAVAALLRGTASCAPLWPRILRHCCTIVQVLVEKQHTT